MSKETLDQFIQKVTDSEELQTRIGEEIDADSLIALGAEHGCEFSAEDLAENVELSDEELDGVAGGGEKLPVIKLHKFRIDGKKPRDEFRDVEDSIRTGGMQEKEMDG